MFFKQSPFFFQSLICLSLLSLIIFFHSCSSESPDSPSPNNEEPTNPQASIVTPPTEPEETISCNATQELVDGECIAKKGEGVVFTEYKEEYTKEVDEICASLEIEGLQPKGDSLKADFAFLENPLQTITELIETTDETCQRKLETTAEESTADMTTVITDQSEFNCEALNLLDNQIATLISGATGFNAADCAQKVSTPAVLVIRPTDTTGVEEAIIEATAETIPLAISLPEKVITDGQIPDSLVQAVLTSDGTVAVVSPETTNQYFIAKGEPNRLDELLTRPLLEEQEDYSNDYKTKLETIFTGETLAVKLPTGTSISIPAGDTLYIEPEEETLQVAHKLGEFTGVKRFSLCNITFPDSLQTLIIKLPGGDFDNFFVDFFCQDDAITLPDSLKTVFIRGSDFDNYWINMSGFDCETCQLDLDSNMGVFFLIQTTTDFKLKTECPQTKATVFTAFDEKVVSFIKAETLNLTESSLAEMYQKISNDLTTGDAQNHIPCLDQVNSVKRTL